MYLFTTKSLALSNIQIYSLNVLKVKLLKCVSVLLLDVGVLTRCLWGLDQVSLVKKQIKKEIKARQIAKWQGHFLRARLWDRSESTAAEQQATD